MRQSANGRISGTGWCKKVLLILRDFSGRSLSLDAQTANELFVKTLQATFDVDSAEVDQNRTASIRTNLATYCFVREGQPTAFRQAQIGG